MNTVFTLTGNLLAESAMTFDMPQEGRTARAKAECGARFQVGGKGVNVARAAKLAGAKTVAVIFPAGFTGARCLNALEKEDFCGIIAPPIDGETREGLVCINAKNGSETTFLGADIPVGESAFFKALAEMEKKCECNDVIAICGSFPGWKKSFAGNIDELRRRKNLFLCIDSYGPPLEDLARLNCDILKINRNEFFSTLAKDRKDDGRPETFESAFLNARKSCNAKIIAVSDGANPVLCMNGNEFFKMRPPQIDREVSATGCGDIMFACLVTEIVLKGADTRKAMERACRWAAESAAQRGAVSAERIAQILKS